MVVLLRLLAAGPVCDDDDHDDLASGRLLCTTPYVAKAKSEEGSVGDSGDDDDWA
jgi:hypothetical protein